MELKNRRRRKHTQQEIWNRVEVTSAFLYPPSLKTSVLLTPLPVITEMLFLFFLFLWKRGRKTHQQLSWVLDDKVSEASNVLDLPSSLERVVLFYLRGRNCSSGRGWKCWWEQLWFWVLFSSAMVSLRKGLLFRMLLPWYGLCLCVFVQGWFCLGNRNMEKRPISLCAAGLVFTYFKSSGCRAQQCMMALEMVPMCLKYADPIHVVMVISQNTVSSPPQRVCSQETGGFETRRKR